ncbi:MAG1140 family protein [Mycoplasma sp. 6243]|uniref:MAG1140 family protein n=1 Tax=Mycoplasma sp. 6243 TaxID=3440865 RepID=UPI003EBC08C5
MKKYKISFLEYLLLFSLLALLAMFIYLIMYQSINKYQQVIIRQNNNELILKNITYDKLALKNYQIDFNFEDKLHQYQINIDAINENEEIIIKNSDLSMFLKQKNLEFIPVRLIESKELIYKYIYNWFIHLFN